MLLLTILLTSLASTALGGLANFCVQEPFRQMQEFRGFSPAMDRCALHYAAQTMTKTLPNVCLTTTKTIILATNTVQVTSQSPCPTTAPHLDIRAAVPLNRRDLEVEEQDLDKRARDRPDGARAPARATGTDAAERSKERASMHAAQTSREENRASRQAERTSREDNRASRQAERTSREDSRQSRQAERTSREESRASRQSDRPTHSHSPTVVTPPTTSASPTVSLQPREVMDEQRHAGPSPVAIFPRDAAATQTAAWSSYYGALAECGYECIRTACSCVGTLKVELKTPVPTCTSTLTKETILHETKTIILPHSQC